MEGLSKIFWTDDNYCTFVGNCPECGSEDNIERGDRFECSGCGLVIKETDKNWEIKENDFETIICDWGGTNGKNN